MELSKTLFTGKFVGTDEFGNKYYKNKADQRWVIYSKDVEATKITSDWYLWMHHTINKIPDYKELKKYSWQKKHAANKTGTKRVTNRQKKKIALKKNMKLGNKNF